MTEAEEAALARAAGLEKAWAEHREDVQDAIANAHRLRAAFARPEDAAAEPAPPYSAPRPAGISAPRPAGDTPATGPAR